MDIQIILFTKQYFRMKDQVHLIILICTLITMGWRQMISYLVQKNLQTLL